MTKGTAALLSLALSACAAPPPPAPPARLPPAARADAGLDAAPPPAPPDAGGPLPSLDALASRAPVVAPLMREIERVDDASRPVTIPAPGEGDYCVRAVVASSRPARAWIEDDAQAPRGDVARAITTGPVPPAGPACAKRGETLRLVIDGGDGPLAARAVVLASP